MAVRGSPRQGEAKKKQVAVILKSTGLNITISSNLKVVDFLDLTLDLSTGTYKTYNKPNNTPLYVHVESNHPPNVTKNIPLAVNKRISSNSSTPELFESTKAPFQKALQDSGYKHNLNFEQTNSISSTSNKRTRTRKILYFNPPFSTGVKSKTCQQVLKLIDTCFPPSNPLHKIFNRHTVKVSYRTTPNIKQVISAHNRKTLNKQTPKQKKTCTCRAEPCPVGGKCKEECTIHQATVTHTDPDSGTEQNHKYIGLAATTFYQRHQNHKTTFKNKEHQTKSKLSEHIWKLKDKNVNFEISWKIIDKAPKFSPISKTCKLCTLERYYLICRTDLHTLNKNNKFGNDCLHRRFLKLSTSK